MKTPPTPLHLLPAVFMLLAGGCAHSPDARIAKDDKMLAAQSRAVQRAMERAGESVVFFQVESTAQGPRGPQSRTVSFSGVVLTAEGHLLAPFPLRQDNVNRVEAWVGERRYLARPLKTEDSLGMSVLKVEPFEPLTPISLAEEAELQPGETGYAVISTDESREFARFVFPGFCQGIIEGRYRQYSMSMIPEVARGAPMFNHRGELVGITTQNAVWRLDDLRDTLEDLLARVSRRADGEEDPEGSDDAAWFGAILGPINPDYARAQDLPRSALWLTHVFADGSAHAAGFRTGDLLIALNDEPLRLSGSRVYQYFIQTLRARENDPFTATVIRDGKEIHGSGVLFKRPEPDSLRAEDLGITVTELHESHIVRYNLRDDAGVMVTELKPGSPAATGRNVGVPLLRPRDVIVSIGGHPTPDLKAFGQALDRIRAEKPAALLVHFTRGPLTGMEALNLTIGENNSREAR